ncbi:MAG: hypothetical protein KBC73_18080 [Burkholderiaceae bacterium]|nr:hypothetical protein [Burkholderiaceae bacterium]
MPASDTAAQPACPLRRRLLGWAGLLGAGALGLAAPAVRAWGDATPQCGSAPPPAFPPVDRPPLLQCWIDADRQDGPRPDCSLLRQTDHGLLIRLTASAVLPGGLDEQLARFGAVSQLKGLPYWSYTDRKRQVLIRDSYAVETPGSTTPRPDYTLADLQRGRDLFFVHSDNRSSALVPYAIRLVHQDADRVHLRIENHGDIRFMGLSVVAPGEMQWGVMLERLGGTRYGYRSLLGLKKLRYGTADKHRLSNLARVVAMFDLWSGRQTDIEPFR